MKKRWHDPASLTCGFRIDDGLKFSALRTRSHCALLPLLSYMNVQAARPVCFNRIDRRILIRDQTLTAGDFQSVDDFPPATVLQNCPDTQSPFCLCILTQLMICGISMQGYTRLLTNRGFRTICGNV